MKRAFYMLNNMGVTKCNVFCLCRKTTWRVPSSKYGEDLCRRENPAAVKQLLI